MVEKLLRSTMCMFLPSWRWLSRSDSWLQWTLWAIIMSLIMGWVARSRRQPRAAGYARRLQHPSSTLIIGLVCFLFFAGIAVISNVYANATTTWLTTTVFGGVCSAGATDRGGLFCRAARGFRGRFASYRTAVWFRWSDSLGRPQKRSLQRRNEMVSP